MISYKKEYFDEENGQIENLDTLSLKKIKGLSSKVDAIKGYSVIDNNKHAAYAVINTETLINKEVLEIDLEGDLWKVAWKDIKIGKICYIKFQIQIVLMRT